MHNWMPICEKVEKNKKLFKNILNTHKACITWNCMCLQIEKKTKEGGYKQRR